MLRNRRIKGCYKVIKAVKRFVEIRANEIRKVRCFLDDKFSRLWQRFAICALKPDAGFTRTDLTRHLESKNIQTRNLFAGNILRHPCFDSLVEGVDYRVAGSLDNTETIMNATFWVGLYPGMGEKKIDYMIDVIRKFCVK